MLVYTAGHAGAGHAGAGRAETWTGKEKITDGQEKTEEEEQDQEEEEEEEEEMTNTPVHSQHDPEDL